jgi:hypothetical protein
LSNLVYISQIVIEFHNPFSEKEIQIFDKFEKNHILVHFHANNCCGLRNHNGIQIPNIFECTYIHKKYYNTQYLLNNDIIPSQIDMRNVTQIDEIKIDYYPFVSQKEKYVLIFVCHDYIISLGLLEKYKNCYILFVGDRHCIEHKRIIIARNLQFNIEHIKELLSFTAWYAIIKNNLFIEYEYLCILEYDVIFDNNFNKNLEKKINEKIYDVISFCEDKYNFFLYFDLSVAEKFFTLKKIKNNIQVNHDTHWNCTTNHCLKYNILRDFVDFYFPDYLEIKKNDNIHISWYHERIFWLYKMNNNLNSCFVHGLTHFYLDSHKEIQKNLQ